MSTIHLPVYDWVGKPNQSTKPSRVAKWKRKGNEQKTKITVEYDEGTLVGLIIKFIDCVLWDLKSLINWLIMNSI